MMSGSGRRVCHVCRLGLVDYGVAWELQKTLAQARAAELIPDTLLLLEHPPTYTLGRRAKEAHLLAPRHILAEQGVAVYDVDRGGDVTFHGPGQLVGYPVLSLEGWEGGPGRYLRTIEEVLIQALAGFGIGAERLVGLTGVWVGNEKIAAIGVKINACRITGHGFALNVATDISYFERIIPCGIRGKGVTSLSRVLGRGVVSLDDAAREVVHAFGRTFDLEMKEINLSELPALGVPELDSWIDAQIT
jgi:lipoate-protein ligase B